ncbi:response regulator [Sinorhizobium fredii]|uniref:response regulator n=1 Tax=Rhizobium fredii TaxID=380 RepID=UPI0026940174
MEFLPKHAFSVRAVENGQQAGSKMASEVIDLAIIDMSLRREDGHWLVGDFGAKIDLPIIIISGDDLEEGDNISRLHTGALDCISKPFGLPELLTRVSAALRDRPERHRNRIFHFDDWRVSTKRRRLRRGTNGEVKLTAGEFNLLMAFLNNPGRSFRASSFWWRRTSMIKRSLTAASMLKSCAFAAS